LIGSCETLPAGRTRFRRVSPWVTKDYLQKVAAGECGGES